MDTERVEKMYQWWQLTNPCRVNLFGLEFNVCKEFESCKKDACTQKNIHQAAGYLLEHDLESYENALNSLVAPLIAEDGEKCFNLLEGETIEKLSQIETCSRNCLDVTESYLSVRNKKEICLLNKINNLGDLLISRGVDNTEFRVVILREMKMTVREALNTDLFVLDGIAKLAVILGLEDRVSQFKDIPLFRNEIKLRSRVLEDV